MMNKYGVVAAGITPPEEADEEEGKEASTPARGPNTRDLTATQLEEHATTRLRKAAEEQMR
jgi:hypothetical protein